jgi:DNA-binding CsgD family transcriptional regulator
VSGRKPRSAAFGLTVALALQSLAAVFFVADVFEDLRAGAAPAHMILEILVTLALILGIVAGFVALRQTMAHLREQDQALATASGALMQVIAQQFSDWGLTAAESDVAHLALKGLDIADIATLRGTAPGTVRAQLTRIYAKAGVTGRAQFAAWFVEDLMTEGLPAAPAVTAAPLA